jgi:probable DNA repair protein
LVQCLYDITPLEPLINDGFTLLTPNQRLARRIKAEWDARQAAGGALAWETVSVQPLEPWLQQQWESASRQNLVPQLAPLAPAQALEVWRQVVEQYQSQSAEFHLLQPAAAAELASQARDTLLRWQVDVDANGIRSLFHLDSDCRTFLRWLRLFNARLARAGQCTQTDCLVHLAALAGQLPTTRVALVEFDLLAPLQHAALAVLTTEVLHVAPSAQVAHRIVHAFSDNRSEFQAVAAWAANVHRSSPDTTIGIVPANIGSDRVPLEYLLRRELDCLGLDYSSLPVNFSTGIALDKTPLVRDALAVLAMGLQHTTVTAVETLLRSRFLDLPDAHSALAQRFVRQLYAQGSAVLPVAELLNDANRVSLGGARGLCLGQRLRALQGMRHLRRKALPSAWMMHFSDILSNWGWPGTQALDSLEYQQRDLWDRTLDVFATFDAVCEPMQFDAALTLLRDCCKRQVSQPQTVDSPIQVLGPLEAAGLSFDELWLCGMQGSDWPAAPRPSPFIPLALQTRLRMPHASPEREWAFADALLSQYARNSKFLHASYCRQRDGVPELPSALLQDFAADAPPQPAAVWAEWLRGYQERELEMITDDSAPRVDTNQRSSIQGGSSLLQDQSQCPFRAFAKHRLQVEPLGTLHVSLSAAERGSLLHDALALLWGDLCTHEALLALDDVGQEKAVIRAVQAAIANVPFTQQRKAGAAYWRLEERRLTALLYEWLELERQRGPFTVVARELEVTLELARLPISLRVDRVDQLPDGSRMIIDYKPRNSSVQDWFGNRPAQPQLPLYRIAETDCVTGMAFAVVRPRECRFVGLGPVSAAPGLSEDLSRLAKNGIDVQVWSELGNYWRNTLECLASSFVAGDAPVDPLTASSCTWCGLQPLCRIGDRFDDPTDLEQGNAV